MRTAVITVILLFTAAGTYDNAHSSGETTVGIIGSVAFGTIAMGLIITVVILGLDYRKRNQS